MRLGRFSVAICIVLMSTWLFSLQSAASSPIEAEALYRRAREGYYALKGSKKNQRYRSNWLKCIHLYEKVYQTFPESDWADDALFMMGRLYEGLHSYSSLQLCRRYMTVRKGLCYCERSEAISLALSIRICGTSHYLINLACQVFYEE